MPVGPYATFGECVSAQQKKGKSKEAAGAICGEIEKRTKSKNELEDTIFMIQQELVNKKLAKLTSKARKNLPSSSFVFPKERRYPIHDRAHAANALARVSQHGSSSEKAKVRQKVCAKYPDLPACKKEKSKNEIVLKAMEMGIDLNIIEEILNEDTLKSTVETLLSAIIKRWTSKSPKKEDIDAFREAVWFYRDIKRDEKDEVDDKKGVVW